MIVETPHKRPSTAGVNQTLSARRNQGITSNVKAPLIMYDLKVFDGSKTTISFFNFDRAFPVTVKLL